MSVSFVDAGAFGAGSASCTPGYPTVVTAGNLLVCLVAWGNDTDTPPSTPTGFTAPANNSVVGGEGVWGVDEGNRGAAVFYRIADGTETGTVTVSNAGSGATRTTGAVILQFSKTLGSWVTPVCASGGDTTEGTGFSVTATTDPGGLNGDMLVWAASWVPDTATPSSPSITWTGTSPSLTQRSANNVGSGNDVRLTTYTSPASGTSSAAPVYAATLSAAGDGAVMFMRLRDETTSVPATTNGVPGGSRGSAAPAAAAAEATVTGTIAPARSSSAPGEATVTAPVETIGTPGHARASTPLGTASAEASVAGVAPAARGSVDAGEVQAEVSVEAPVPSARASTAPGTVSAGASVTAVTAAARASSAPGEATASTPASTQGVPGSARASVAAGLALTGSGVTILAAAVAAGWTATAGDEDTSASTVAGWTGETEGNDTTATVTAGWSGS